MAISAKKRAKEQLGIKSEPLAKDAPKLPSIRGGKREGAGRKPREIEELSQDSLARYNEARADKEEQNAKLAELEYNIKSGEYIPREDVRNASAKAFAVITQTLRSIPDNIERRTGVAPGVAQAIGILIDDALADLAGDLEAIHAEAAPNV